ncbi:MAG: DUF1801 domain-containing protein, partial [Myxococcales bacterium]|nr:DUF1801 domain-containing protein [Myxococcales bacterium]
MASSNASTVAAYLASLPPERRAPIQAVRQLIRSHLPRGYEERMQYGMIGYVVPPARKPDTYNGQPLAIVSLASQKRHLALYLMGLYGAPGVEARLRAAYQAAGKRLDLGKCCLRFRSLDDLVLDAVGDVLGAVSVEAFIKRHDAVHGGAATATRRTAAKKAPRTP